MDHQTLWRVQMRNRGILQRPYRGRSSIGRRAEGTNSKGTNSEGNTLIIVRGRASVVFGACSIIRKCNQDENSK